MTSWPRGWWVWLWRGEIRNGFSAALRLGLLCIVPAIHGAVLVPVIRELTDNECKADAICLGTMPEAHFQPGVMFVPDAFMAKTAPEGKGKFEDAPVMFTKSLNAKHGNGQVEWGLDAIDQRKPPTMLDNKPIRFANNGAGTVVYSLDTGLNCETLTRYSACTVDAAAVEFDPDANAQIAMRDRNGHGTSMALIASTLAAGAEIVGIPVLDHTGHGDLTRVLFGFNRVLTLHRQHQNKFNQTVQAPGIILAPLSTNALPQKQLGEGSVAHLISAVIATLKDQNVVTIVSAGNRNIDACTVAPGSAPDAITTAGMLQTAKRAQFSNWGPCANVFAPSNAVAVAGSVPISGTSVSAAYAAGVAATIASSARLNGHQIQQALLRNASRYIIKDAKGTSNRHVYAPPARRKQINENVQTYKAAAVLTVGLTVTAAAALAARKQQLIIKQQTTKTETQRLLQHRRHY